MGKTAMDMVLDDFDLPHFDGCFVSRKVLTGDLRWMNAEQDVRLMKGSTLGGARRERTEVAGDCSNQVCRRRRKRERDQRSEEGLKFLWLSAEGQKVCRVWGLGTGQSKPTWSTKFTEGGAIHNSAAAPPPRKPVPTSSPSWTEVPSAKPQRTA